MLLRGRESEGQASVELVAVLPVVVAVLAALWQAAALGHASWSAAAAARAAARAAAVGGDARAAARAHLPARLERGLRISLKEEDGGSVAARVRVRVPSVFGLRVVRHTSARAAFAVQR